MLEILQLFFSIHICSFTQLSITSRVQYVQAWYTQFVVYSFADFKLRDLNPIIDFVMSDSCIVVDVVARCSQHLLMSGVKNGWIAWLSLRSGVHSKRVSGHKIVVKTRLKIYSKVFLKFMHLSLVQVCLLSFMTGKKVNFFLSGIGVVICHQHI